MINGFDFDLAMLLLMVVDTSCMLEYLNYTIPKLGEVSSPGFYVFPAHLLFFFVRLI